MAPRVNRQALLDIYLQDLDDTLQKSAQSARTIERSFTLTAHVDESVLSSVETPAIHLGEARRQSSQTARRLVQNVSDCRASLQKLQRELKRLRADGGGR